MEIHDKRMRKKNEEVRKQIKQLRDEEYDQRDAEKAQEQDDIIRQQALREQQFLEQRNKLGSLNYLAEKHEVKRSNAPGGQNGDQQQNDPLHVYYPIWYTHYALRIQCFL